MCGGTSTEKVYQGNAAGLSPRVRGNPAGLDAAREFLRSIPACAGEPARAAGGFSIPGVYPRVCGGTGQGAAAGAHTAGLSPRVRGNLP